MASHALLSSPLSSPCLPASLIPLCFAVNLTSPTHSPILMAINSSSKARASTQGTHPVNPIPISGAGSPPPTPDYNGLSTSMDPAQEKLQASTPISGGGSPPTLESNGISTTK
ncbi:unnamed protein product, partial [Ilex paraguariensis]